MVYGIRDRSDLNLSRRETKNQMCYSVIIKSEFEWAYKIGIYI